MPHHSQIVDVLCLVRVKGTLCAHLCLFLCVGACMHLCEILHVCASVFVCVHLLEVLAAAEAGVNKITPFHFFNEFVVYGRQ